MMSKQILMIVTGHDHIQAGHPTGLWFEEFAAPYALFREHGYSVVAVTPNGGAAPIDPNSLPADTTDAAEALDVLKQTAALNSVTPSDFDAVFLPGGHGTMFDLPAESVGRVVGAFADAGKVVAAVCHGPAGLVGARRADSSPVVAGHQVTGFTNAEEDAAQLSALMPFLLQDKLTELGANFEAAPMWSDHVVVDRLLVTGQNPQSSRSTAEAVVRLLERVPQR